MSIVLSVSDPFTTCSVALEVIVRITSPRCAFWGMYSSMRDLAS